jgi:hypothetical protein
MLTGTYVNSIDTAVGAAGTFWWSGSLSDGSASTANCSGWNDSSITLFGEYGGINLDTGSSDCSIMHTVLCVAY